MNYEHDKTKEVLSTMKQVGYDLGKKVAKQLKTKQNKKDDNTKNNWLQLSTNTDAGGAVQLKERCDLLD